MNNRILAVGVVAAIVAGAQGVLNYLVPLAFETEMLDGTGQLVVVGQAGGILAFLLTYGLVLGTAVWAGRDLAFDEVYRPLAAVTFLAATVTHFLGLAVVLFGFGVADLSHMPLRVLPVLWRPPAVGVELAVAAVAGAALGSLR